MFIALISILVIVCIGLILLILIQPGESAGLSQTFGGSSQRTIFGARSSTFLVRTTAVLAALFLLICLALAILSARRTGSLMERVSPVEQKSAVTGVEKVVPMEQKTTEAEKLVPSEQKAAGVEKVVPAEPQKTRKTPESK